MARENSDAGGPGDIDEIFDRAGRILLERHPEDDRGRMFHSPGLKTGGAFYGFVGGGDLIVKLPADRVAELIAAGTGRPCRTRPGRPMRQWVCLTPADVPTCVTYLGEARTFVAGFTGR